LFQSFLLAVAAANDDYVRRRTLPCDIFRIFLSSVSSLSTVLRLRRVMGVEVENRAPKSLSREAARVPHVETVVSVFSSSAKDGFIRRKTTTGNDSSQTLVNPILYFGEARAS
jgi:hypothetical protein